MRTRRRHPIIGIALVAVVAVGLLRLNTLVAQARSADLGPYRPGRYIEVRQGSAPFHGDASACTGGFVVSRFGRSYGLVSRHCGPVGSEVWLGHYGEASAKLGPIAYVSDQVDAAMFEIDPSQGYLWADGKLLRVSGLVRESALTKGLRLYQHGARTGDESAGRIVLRTAEGLWCLDIDDGLAQHGDSGGPVYAYADDGSVLAAGLITAATDERSSRLLSCFVPIEEALGSLNAKLRVRSADGHDADVTR